MLASRHALGGRHDVKHCFGAVLLYSVRGRPDGPPGHIALTSARLQDSLRKVSCQVATEGMSRQAACNATSIVLSQRHISKARIAGRCCTKKVMLMLACVTMVTYVGQAHIVQVAAAHAVLDKYFVT